METDGTPDAPLTVNPDSGLSEAASPCPAASAALDDDLFGPAAIADPHSYFARLQRDDPVYWNELHQLWVVTGYDDITSILSDPTTFSSQVISRSDEPFPPVERADLALFDFVKRYVGAQLDEQDGTKHAAMRHVLQTQFTPRALEALRPRIRRVIAELLADLNENGVTDFKTAFALPLPVSIITALIGIAPDQHEQVRLSTTKVLLSSQSERDRLRHQAEGIQGLFELVAPLVRERENAPGDDLISVLIAGRRQGAFTTHEVLVNAAMLVVSGHETTVNLLCNGLLAFIRHPDQWARLRRDLDGLGRSAVEECLRFDPPVKSIQRIVVRDTVMQRKPMRKGDRVRCFLSAGNRDPAAFADPARFDIGRMPGRHVAFGLDTHHCLGASLARLEAQESFKALSERFPQLWLAQGDLEYRRSISHRSLASLPIRWCG